MKKVIALAVTVILVMSVIPVMAADEEEEKRAVFETDVRTKREGDYLSVYDGNIREKLKGELRACNGDCIGLCYCTRLSHVLEDTVEDDFYLAFFNNFNNYVGYPIVVYEDCSDSMDTFCYEKASILKNLSPFLKTKNIEKVFKHQKTDLYGLLSSYKEDSDVSMPREIPVIITDLWDTKAENMSTFAGTIIFCVPYLSTNRDGVLHCEEFVNDILWNHSLYPTSTSIYVVYIDEVITQYSNGYHNDMEGYIDIYVP